MKARDRIYVKIMDIFLRNKQGKSLRYKYGQKLYESTEKVNRRYT